ncbi:helix-turn-helix domain-containing protein [Massilibacterium senegalense]|uniref:helix-turn-helix domain-containing protein n=1 Tax=Massilibacterium senegalense TaxID=1632858 RepID=UPI000783B22B|nr:helix-turn-helix domain-containing protein [Massilibacterium senegalense]
MYLTVKETAAYLEMPESYIVQWIHEKRIRAVFDGEQYLINKEQFNHHLKQVENMKKQWEEWLTEPLPEDIDVKDED